MQGKKHSRRSFLRASGGGLFGLSLAELLALRGRSPAAAGETTFGRAKSCIVLFAWGGMSHLDTWDPKPLAGTDVRSVFTPIATSVPGIQISEHMPQIARRVDKMAIVRSVHHKASDHREAAYWNLTGHEPRRLGAPAIEPSREDWPSLGSMVAHARRGARQRGMPGTVSIPYPIADRGLLNGQYAGILGTGYDPVYARPQGGRTYAGVSPKVGALSLDPVAGLDAARLARRRTLLSQLEAKGAGLAAAPGGDDPLERAAQYREQAFDMVTNSRVRQAFDVTREPPNTREAYGDHICGQSVLLARRLTDAGVPLVTVYCCAGDLNGSAGSHWDTHGDGFNRLKRDMLPPLDRASGALIDDLAATGRLDETLIVWLTEFGRTPKLKPGGGRDHFPSCYSVAFAGAGIAGGQVYGRSDKTASTPASQPCGPEHLHATIFRALGINPKTTFTDLQGRPRYLCDADPLPLG